MASEAPPFWYNKPGLYSALIAPISWVYGRIAGRRLRDAPRRKVSVPVICIGNYTVGGAGKTPTSIAIAKVALSMGRKPGFLTRGYGGSVTSPTLVDAAESAAYKVGDEPLLLAQVAPTMVSPDRYAGAKKLLEEDIDLIIMDDGFQSAQLWFDLTVIVVDAARGLGNGKIMPSGPVRAPIKDQLLYTDMLLTIGESDHTTKMVRTAARAGKPVFHAQIDPQNLADLDNVPYLAFAAIGDPEKFFDTLRTGGVDLKATMPFPDHNFFTSAQAADIVQTAEDKNLKIVTTAKDMTRLKSGQGRVQELAEKSEVLNIDLKFDDQATGRTMIEQAIRNFTRRKLQQGEKA